MTPKEIFFEMLKPDGKPERMLKQYEAIAMLFGDPAMLFVRGMSKPGEVIKDKWGVSILTEEGAPGPIPLTDEQHKVLKDITRWREQVHFPQIETVTQGWEATRERMAAQAGEDKLSAVFMPTGIFEQCHFLMGFEDMLTNLYEHPDEMHELINAIADYRIRFAKLLIENLHPDAIFSHDDWGTKSALFMKPEMWREFFKEPYRRFYGYIRSQGVIAIHHADSFLEPIVEDMVEIGIQCWQGVLPENDIPRLQKQLNGRMVLMGGIGAAIDRQDASEEEIRSYVADKLQTYCPGGHYIPSITYGAPGTVFKHVDPIIDDEIEKYNSRLHLPQIETTPVPTRKMTSAPAAAEKTADNETANTDILAKLAAALKKGQKKRVVTLTQQALEEGIHAQKIVNEGLVMGMNELGEDFSANRAFVPEMLMAARCMNEATAILKPILAGQSSSGPSGRVCIGTVKGDMHDIGKNLVKIMMEGSGLEVIDLGTDVAAERFVATAMEQNCNIICCSSLLTTCMDEMRNVVELAKQSGIRSKVKIMVGGAPTSQGFCDEIGADVYTKDAGEAARTALELLSVNA